ncbi:uncharacterized protein SKDI_08G0020 [Saccharomyces kudriavzevii IFO 1802]|uniref:Uncharacterized protein n=2 Tax=Saccharomyces kudriavzevii (strain ATCC MYA-4449 / AS 2.2408 / CBS 8840 / NBRC 1802 / NCYC 2889) TaxID=226230 RepID=J6E9N7_SACK1|nr:uncharacterized protein SKDI_08G0020 [Saccharomyces kudriavzevii IFO 1802]EJT41294.1 hypothetical protein SKUD_194702 [Saccharomyces kudriavzevii IFO 1802]CAI4063305.1 hypothetical protein SKDI_08G0020 [Saccharomyces kudriavzevii IFO 1802]
MRDTKAGYEKVIGSLFFGSLESQKTVLAKNIFRNRFTWSCYEIFKSLAFRIWLLSWLPLTVWWKISSNWIYPYLVTAFMFLGPVLSPLTPMTFHEHALSKQFTQFSKEIIKSSPGIHVDDWEATAANFNSFMHENRLWNTEYFFFDGLSCQEAFRTTILEPFSSGKDDDAILKAFGNSLPFVEEAIKVYYRKLDRQWNLMNCEGFSWNIEQENIKLPKRPYLSKLISVLKMTTIKNPRFLVFAIAYLICFFCIPRLMLPHFLFFGAVSSCLMIEYMALFDNSRFQSLKVEHKMRYLSDIISEHKKSNVSAWDNIAKSMNVYLFEQKARSSEDFFLNATDCEHFFRRFFCTSSVPKQFASINSSIVELRPYIKEVQSACCDEQLL